MHQHQHCALVTCIYSISLLLFSSVLLFALSFAPYKYGSPRYRSSGAHTHTQIHAIKTKRTNTHTNSIRESIFVFFSFCTSWPTSAVGPNHHEYVAETRRLDHGSRHGLQKKRKLNFLSFKKDRNPFRRTTADLYELFVFDHNLMSFFNIFFEKIEISTFNFVQKSSKMCQKS